MTDDSAVPENASDSIDPGPPLRNFDGDHHVVSEVEEAPDENAVPQEATDSNNPGPPLRKDFEDESPVVREAVAIVTGNEPDEEVLTSSEKDAIDAVIDATDVGNANRFDAIHSADHRYLTDEGKWLDFNGIRWEPDTVDRSLMLAIEVTERMLRDAAELYEEDTRAARYEADQLLSHAYKSRSRGRLRAMVEIAQALPTLQVQSDQLDADPYRLGCENGTVDLKTGSLVTPDRDDFITRSTGIEYDPSATCPEFEKFILWAMSGNEEMVDFVQRLIGYTICGDAVERIMVEMYGPTGSNGKSTLLRVMERIMGDYGLSADASTFEKASFRKGGGGPAAHITAMQGKRYVGASEFDKDYKLAVAQMKNLTGGDTISARGLYEKEATTFKGTSTIWFASNAKLELPPEDQAMWDRLKFIPFNARVEDQDKDRQLDDKLAAELPGILNWAVRGCLEWQKRGLESPESVKEATASYRDEMDNFKLFLEDLEVIGCFDWTSTSLHQRYTDFARDNDLPKLNQREFKDAMIRAGFDKVGHDRHWEKVK